MKTLLNLLLLLSLSLPALAQLPTALSWTDYRLNPAQHTVRLDSAWSAQVATVKVYDTPGGTAYPDFVLPTLTREGNTLFVSFTPIQLARLADKSYVTISTGGIVRLAGYLNLGYSTSAPTSSTSAAFSGIVSWDLIKAKPVTFPSTLNGVVGLSAALAGKVDTSSVYTRSQVNQHRASQVNTDNTQSAGITQNATSLTALQNTVALKANTADVEPGVLKFDTYALAVAGLTGRAKPARVLIAHDEVNNAGQFGKYDWDGSTLIEDLL